MLTKTEFEKDLENLRKLQEDEKIAELEARLAELEKGQSQK